MEHQSGYFKLAIASLIWTLLYRLFPYGWSLPLNLSPGFIIHQFSQDQLAELKDYIELFLSLVSFAIFGFAVTGILRIKRLKAIPSLAIILLTCAFLGAGIEVLQALTPSRNPNLLDILTDALGGGLGWMSYQQWRSPILGFASVVEQNAKLFLRRLALPTLAIGFVSYFLIASLGVMLLPAPTGFSNWDMSFPLMLGNELTGDRPWQGSVGAVQIFDRAISSTEIKQLFAGNAPTPDKQNALIASYNLTEKRDRYSDKTGHLPDLLWQGNAPNGVSNTGIRLSSSHWLQTSAPATYLSQQMKQNTQLSLDITVSPETLSQDGPARIISLSQDPTSRNFTLGQDDSNLVFRLRTPLTGGNGSNPQITVPNVFTDMNPHHIVVTYANATLQIFVDGLQRVHTFQFPEMVGYKMLSYAIVFVPLGFLLGLILLVIRGSAAMYAALLLSGIALPLILFESFLSTNAHHDFAFGNIAIGLTFCVGALLVVRGPVHQWLKEI